MNNIPIVLCAVAAFAPGRGASGPTASAAAEDGIVRSSSTPRLLVVEVAGAQVSADGAFLTHVQEPSGADVVLQAWRMPPDAHPVVLVNDGTSRWRAYGPAHDEGSGRLRVIDVPLGPGLARGQHVLVRGGILPEPQAAPGAPVAPETLARAVVLSPAVHVEVAARGFSGGWDCDVRLQSANGQVIREARQTLVSSPAAFAGTIECRSKSRAVAAAVDRDAEHDPRPLVYLAHRCGADASWELTAAASHDGIWRVSDVELARQAPRDRYRCQIRAVASFRSLATLGAWPQDWRDAMVGASDDVEVVVEPTAPAATRKLDRISIEELVLAGGRSISVGDRKHHADIAVERDLVGARGVLETLREDQRVLVLAAVAGTNTWLVLGPAVVDAGSWMVLLDRLPDGPPGDAPQVQLVAVQSAGLRPGTRIGYEEWSSQATGISPPVTLAITDRASSRHSRAPSLSLDQIDGLDYAPGDSVLASPGAWLSGEVSGVPAGRRHHVALALELPGQAGWTVGASTPVTDTGWALAIPDQSELRSPIKRAVVVLTDKSLDARQLSTPQLYSLAVAHTPPLHIRTGATSSSLAGGSMLPIVALALFALMLLSLVTWKTWVGGRARNPGSAGGPPRAPLGTGDAGATASLRDRVAQLAARMDDALRNKLPWLDQPTQSHWSVIGLALGVLLATLIGIYAPVYTSALQKVFGLPVHMARRIAFMLIAFTGSTGILVDLLSRVAGVGAYLFRAVLALATPLSWFFASYVYYEGHRLDGNEMAALALATAVFLGNLTETLGAYLSLKLSGELAVWIVVQAIRAPLVLLRNAGKAQPPPPPPAVQIEQWSPVPSVPAVAHGVAKEARS